MREAQVQSLGQEDPLEKENGNPLQYSCLENPMEGGAWQATVHGVAKSWTWLSNFTSLHFRQNKTQNLSTESKIPHDMSQPSITNSTLCPHKPLAPATPRTVFLNRPGFFQGSFFLTPVFLYFLFLHLESSSLCSSLENPFLSFKPRWEPTFSPQAESSATLATPGTMFPHPSSPTVMGLATCDHGSPRSVSSRPPSLQHEPLEGRNRGQEAAAHLWVPGKRCRASCQTSCGTHWRAAASAPEIPWWHPRPRAGCGGLCSYPHRSAKR